MQTVSKLSFFFPSYVSQSCNRPLSLSSSNLPFNLQLKMLEKYYLVALPQ